jgi:tetratricopeptide (TPR) repeat protein
VPALTLIGDVKRADMYRLSAEQLAAALGARVPPWMRVARCGRFRFIGDIDAAEQCYADVLDIGRAEGDPLLEIASFRNRGELLLEGRRYRDAEPLLLTALEISVRTGETWNRTEVTAALAHAAAGLGDFARADQLIMDAQALVRPSDTYAAATVPACEAAVRALEGRDDEAAASFRGSIALFSATEFDPRRAGVHLDYAELLERMGQASEAAEQLAVAESLLGEQTGKRAARIEGLRQAVGARKG